MACFIVPLAQAVTTTVLRKKLKKSNESDMWLKQLPKLELMLWGGSAMLVVDHILNGELTYQYPFFTAMEQKDGIYTMLQEMLGVGLPMSLTITAIYAFMVLYESYSQRKSQLQGINK